MASLPGVAVLRGFVSAAACAELSHASRCLPAPGYRPGVRAAPLPLLARVAPGLLPPLLAARGASRSFPPILNDESERSRSFVSLTRAHARATRADRVREAAEALGVGGAEAPLFVEFTGLLTWRGGGGGDGDAHGWHDDASGPHLAQRHVSCELYLNSAGADFGAPAVARFHHVP